MCVEKGGRGGSMKFKEGTGAVKDSMFVVLSSNIIHFFLNGP